MEVRIWDTSRSWPKKELIIVNLAEKGANGYVGPIGTRDKVERVAEF